MTLIYTLHSLSDEATETLQKPLFSITTLLLPHTLPRRDINTMSYAIRSHLPATFAPVQREFINGRMCQIYAPVSSVEDYRTQLIPVRSVMAPNCINYWT